MEQTSRLELPAPAVDRVRRQIAAAALAAWLGVTGCDAKPAEVRDASVGELTAEQCNVPLASFFCVAPDTWCCPETFDGSAAAIPACSSPAFSTYQGTCGDLTVMRRFWITHDIVCYYSGANGTLVGVRKGDDTSAYCDRTSSVQTGGSSPQRTECDYLAFPVVKECP